MSLFRRRGRGSDGEQDGAASSASELDVLDPSDEHDADDGTDHDGTDHDGADHDGAGEYDPEDEFVEEISDRSAGPWDIAERPDLEGYVDLGGIRLLGHEGMELRLELDEATGAVSSVTIKLGSSAVQLQAFAAPRSEGIWPEIRAEIVEGIERQGGHADEVPGTFGRELIARIPARGPDGRTGHTAARFAGVDGPRWFLRAVFHGEAVHKPAAAHTLEDIVREVVVVRGPEAMAPRELLALRLPGGEGDAPVPEPGADELRPFERGPEITEVR